MNPLRQARAAIYDAVITGMTARWYAAVLRRLAPGSRILDVGIGTAAALLAHAPRLVETDVHIVGIDIDADYIERARAEVRRHHLEERVAIRLESVYDHGGGPYDAIYFSGSFMLLPDPAGALRRVLASLRSDGRVYFTQTFERQPSPWLEALKPWLRWLTTIDFGRVTYETDFRHVVGDAGLEILEVETLHAGARRDEVLVVAAAATRGSST